MWGNKLDSSCRMQCTDKQKGRPALSAWRGGAYKLRPNRAAVAPDYLVSTIVVGHRTGEHKNELIWNFTPIGVYPHTILAEIRHNAVMRYGIVPQKHRSEPAETVTCRPPLFIDI